ncbi:hypothetical protein [Rhodococcus opacus]|uniref:Uncharacterized protein n=1 Tax=Rhodococcus opacus TaxID=37919 RepID=A0AAX3Y590_RHOOP|nr:hypothetical protein [Rhodococcus opacus]WLF44517.1 hypothetical protein Q5707_21415 [Rhodococcus opacus]
MKCGLSDARLFTTTAVAAGAPEQAHSTLTGVGHSDGRVVTGQFTTAGHIEGTTINVAGNWWNIIATKAVNGSARKNRRDPCSRSGHGTLASWPSSVRVQRAPFSSSNAIDTVGTASGSV